MLQSQKQRCSNLVSFFTMKSRIPLNKIWEKNKKNMSWRINLNHSLTAAQSWQLAATAAAASVRLAVQTNAVKIGAITDENWWRKKKKKKCIYLFSANTTTPLRTLTNTGSYDFTKKMSTKMMLHLIIVWGFKYDTWLSIITTNCYTKKKNFKHVF